MENLLLDKAIHHIHDIYEKVKLLLLKPDNYIADDIRIDNVQQYLTFVESTLQRPYNRIAHIYAFITDMDGLMNDRMYPFRFLSNKTCAEITSLYLRSEKLIGGLYIILPEDAVVLEKEPFEI